MLGLVREPTPLDTPWIHPCRLDSRIHALNGPEPLVPAPSNQAPRRNNREQRTVPISWNPGAAICGLCRLEREEDQWSWRCRGEYGTKLSTCFVTA